jgi:SAM-dependent methyltransferase
MPFQAGNKPLPGWAVCFNPRGCQGRYQYPKTRDVYFTGSQLNDTKATKRSCMRCQELGKTPNQLAALRRQREKGKDMAAEARAQGLTGGGASGGRHRDPANRAQARTCVHALESMSGDELLAYAAQHPGVFEAYAHHIHDLTRERGARLPHAEILRVGLEQWRAGRSAGSGVSSYDCPTDVLNLGCGWPDRVDAMEAAAVSFKIPAEALVHLDVIQYWKDERIVVGDMHNTEDIDDARFKDGASFDMIFAVNSIYGMDGADQFVAEVARLLRDGGVAVITQYDGYLGEVVLAVARAAAKRSDLAVTRYEEGQTGAEAAAATTEADARSLHGAGAKAAAAGAGGGVASAAVWPVNMVILVKREAGPFKGGGGLERVELPHRVLRRPPVTGADFGVTYTLLLHYHGQIIRGGFASGHALGQKRQGEHVGDLKLGQHDSPLLQAAYDEFVKTMSREPLFDSRSLDSSEASLWGHEFGIPGEFEYTIHQAAEDESSCVLAERITRHEQLLIDSDRERFNACPVAGSTSAAGSSAGGVSTSGVEDMGGGRGAALFSRIDWAVE